MKAFATFLRGLLRMPVHVHAWLLLLGGANLIGVLLWPGRMEAVVVLAVFVLNLLLMVLITAWTGFSRLLGLGHFPWIGLAAFLILRLSALPPGSYANWIGIVLILNGVSLVIDIVDVVRWLRGERGEIVEGP